MIVYNDGSLGKAQYTPEKNIETLTRLLDNGERDESTIFSMLRNIGYQENAAEYAVKNYMKKKENRMNTVTVEGLNISLNQLKNKLNAIVENSNGTINFSANSALEQTINILNTIYEFKKYVNGETEKNELVQSQKLYETLIFARPEMYFSSLSYMKLKNLSKLEAVSEFLTPIYEFLMDNKYTNALSSILISLNENTQNGYYTECISDIKRLLENNETYIKSNINVYLNRHAWITPLKPLLETYSKESTEFVSTNQANVEKVYSPIHVNEDKSVLFMLNNYIYKLDNKIVERVEDYSKIDKNYMAICSILENFEFDEITKKLTIYRYDKSLSFKVDERKIYINDLPVNINDFTQMKRVLLSSNFYNLDETYKIDNVLLMLENFNSIKEFDIITRLKGKNGHIINLIKLDEKNIYINRINKDNNFSELTKVSNFNQAQNLVNEYFKFDISKSMSVFVDKQNSIKNNLLSEKEILEDRVKFLDEKIAYLEYENKGIRNIDIMNAIDMLKEERRVQEIEVEKIYTKLSMFK